MPIVTVEATLSITGADDGVCNGCSINSPEMRKFLALNGFGLACMAGSGPNFATQIKARSETLNSDELLAQIRASVESPLIANCATTNPRILA